MSPPSLESVFVSVPFHTVMDYSFILLLLVSTLIPFSLTQCNREKALPFFRRSVHEFSIELVKRIAQETENHFVTSALSPWTLISTLSLGAADDTLDEIKQVLRLHPHKCFNKIFFEIVTELGNAKDETVFERSSAIFADKYLEIKEEFINRINQTKVSSLQQIDFYNQFYAANVINNYVKESTHGNIDEIVDSTALGNVKLVLIDALYFKSVWLNQFEPENTEESTFYDERMSPIGDVNLMYAEFEANLASVSRIGAKVLELPYGSNKYSMLIILPDEGKTISSVLENLKRITLGTIFKLFEQMGQQTRVSVQIPKFKITSDHTNMKEWLTDMGLKRMFVEYSAQFQELTESFVYVSDIIQKATIEINEKGSEASAATAGFLEGRSLIRYAESFNANRPFLYMIVDRELQLALFTGAYSKPELS